MYWGSGHYRPHECRHGRLRVCATLIGDAVDLDLHVRVGELRLHSRAGGLVLAEELVIDLVHVAEITAVAQEHRAFHDVRHSRTAAFENALDVVQHQPRLVLNVAVYELVRLWIDGPLAGNEDEISGPDRVRIGSPRSRSSFWCKPLNHSYSVLFLRGRRAGLSPEAAAFRVRFTGFGL